MVEIDPARHASRTARGAAEPRTGRGRRRPVALATAGHRRADRDRDHRRSARLHQRAGRPDGRQDRGCRPARARRIPPAGEQRRPRYAARSRSRRSLCTGPRRSPQRPEHGRPPRRLPRRRPSRLARAVPYCGRGGSLRGHPGQVRRIGLRLHRRAVRRQRVRPHRRAGDHGPGQRALPRNSAADSSTATPPSNWPAGRSWPTGSHRAR